MMNRICITLALILCAIVNAQVGIGTTTPNAQLEIAASNPSAPSSTDGILIPRINVFPSINPSVSQDGMLVYLAVGSGSSLPGFYYWNNAAGIWINLSSFKGWDTSGNANAMSGTNFIGTVNAQDIDFRTNNTLHLRLSQKGQIGIYNSGQSIFIGEEAGQNDDLTNNVNTFIGTRSGFSNTSGAANVAMGYHSLFANTVGFSNSAIGNNSMEFNTIGSCNTATGWFALNANTSGNNNTALGYRALYAGSTASWNTAIGANALKNTTTGESNVALGSGALTTNTSGNGNTATGTNSLVSNTIGSGNTAVGAASLHDNIDGIGNTAVGSSTLYYTTSGSQNTAIGASALIDNKTGSGNVASGAFAIRKNVTGINNTAMGRYALTANMDGNSNTASGANALGSNVSGNNNTISGILAAVFNISGSNNTASGASALYSSNGSGNSAFGTGALITNTVGNNNTAVGNTANTSTGIISNATAIGNAAIVNLSDKVRFGNAAVTVIEGQVPYFNPSDARFKFNVKQNVPGLDFIMKLKPVTYNFDTRKFQQYLSQNIPDSLKTDVKGNAFDKSSGIVRTGFLAQDIEKAANELGYDFDGLHIPDASNPTDNYSVAYSQFIMPLVKSVQEQQGEIEALRKENVALKAESEKRKKQMEAFEERLSRLESKN
ncbi:MAG: hypothetical protein EOO50_00905 [Flavobacterium sp.]|uniref:tail fiber domain-containing protein n=1 Tax=Flavobacterium sp. TaxID=239 RepID=UPI001228878A|nr:tail fiber domain-containing protein [Flavobacterium sp.]RZJ68770.1 MAG: hypothetical protein EOO50_00905 [Flavobacterium sp.]